MHLEYLVCRYGFMRLVPQDQNYCLGKPGYCELWGSYQLEGLSLLLLTLVTGDRRRVTGNMGHILSFSQNVFSPLNKNNLEY